MQMAAQQMLYAKAVGLEQCQQMFQQALCGKSLANVPTPRLIVDHKAMKRNQRKMEDYVLTMNAQRHRNNNNNISSSSSPLSPIRIRPHAKLHKSSWFCTEILGSSVAEDHKEAAERRALYSGICVQKVSEMEMLMMGMNSSMPASNFNVFVSNELSHVEKVMRFAMMTISGRQAGSVSTVCVDSVKGVEMLAEGVAKVFNTQAGFSGNNRHAPIGVLLEVNVGQNRGGIASISEDTLSPVINAILNHNHKPSSPSSSTDTTTITPPVLQLLGVHAYHGGAQHIRTLEERQRVVTTVCEKAAKAQSIVRNLILKHNLDMEKKKIKNKEEGPFQHTADLLTGAGSGTFSFEADSCVYNEIQPGSYLVMDRDYLENSTNAVEPEIPVQMPNFEEALFVLATVCNKTFEEDDAEGAVKRVVVDAGHKSSAIDSGMPALCPAQLVRLLERTKRGQSLLSSSPEARAALSCVLLHCGNGGDDHGVFSSSSSPSSSSTPSSVATVIPRDVAVLSVPWVVRDIASGVYNVQPEMASKIAAAVIEALSFGDRVLLIPGHCDPTFNLHDYVVICQTLDQNPESSSSSHNQTIGGLIDINTGAVVTNIAMINARGCQE